MKQFFIKQKWSILFLVLGAIGGYIYWHYWGCSGSCGITSNWHTSSMYGALIGWLVGDFFKT